MPLRDRRTEPPPLKLGSRLVIGAVAGFVATMAMIAAHLSWGWSTAEAIRELSAARETIFVDGPDKDVPSESRRLIRGRNKA